VSQTYRILKGICEGTIAVVSEGQSRT
jgi:hypothetical protein